MLVGYLLGVHELLLLAAGGLLVLAVRTGAARRAAGRTDAVVLPALLAAGEPFLADPTGGQLARLFLTFLKIGSVLYGSGYVLIAFLRGDFVERLGWITETQLVDAVSIGQVTPGPVFTTATFIGSWRGSRAPCSRRSPSSCRRSSSWGCSRGSSGQLGVADRGRRGRRDGGHAARRAP